MFEEQIAIRHLVDTRGRAFVLAFFPEVSEHIIASVYYGEPIPPDAEKYIKKVLRERMCHDDMSAPVAEEIRRLRNGEAREGEGGGLI